MNSTSKASYSSLEIDEPNPLLQSAQSVETKDELTESMKVKDERINAAVTKRSSNFRAFVISTTVFLGILSVVAILSTIIFKNENCLGAPYLYVSHHGAKNIVKLSRDGCLMSEKVLWGNYKKSDLRGMFLGNHENENSLFVVDSRGSSSEIMVFSECSALTGMRTMKRVVLSSTSNSGLNHPYAITADNNDNVFVSSQHTDLVQRFTKDSLQPLPFPSHLVETIAKIGNRKESSVTKDLLYMYPGTFVQFGKPGIHKSSEQGVRGVVITPNNEVWISNEDDNKVWVIDAINGTLITSIDIPGPINLHADFQRDLVFVGSKNTPGAVMGVKASTHTLVTQYTMIGMKHPAGLANYGDILFVADQTTQSIHSFNITNGRYIRRIASGKDALRNLGQLEHLILSPC